MSAKKQQPTIGNLLTPEQAADKLGISVEAVRQYARRPHNRLTSTKFLGRVLFEPAEIARYKAETRAYFKKPA